MPTPVPTYTPKPSAKPTLVPTNKPNSDTPSPTGVQLSGKVTGKQGLSINFKSIASTSSGAVFAAYKARTTVISDLGPGSIYGSLDNGVSWTKQTIQMEDDYDSNVNSPDCDNPYITQSGTQTGVLAGLKATYSSTMRKNVVWFTCGPYEINYGRKYTILDFKACTASTSSNSWYCQAVSTSALSSSFATVGASAVSSDGLKYAVAGQEGGIVLLSVTIQWGGSISHITTMIHDYGSTTLGNNKYGGLAWSSDGAYLLVAPQNGLNLWYFTIRSACFSTDTCYLSSLTKTTSPSLPASTSGSTGTWTSCVAQTDKNYMACTQYGGYTYYSVDSGKSWSKVGTQATYISTLAMYSTDSGKACLAGVSTYGSPYLVTSQDGQRATEWKTQTVGDTYFGKGFYDVTITSCSKIYAAAIVDNTDNNILVTSGVFSEADSADTDVTVTDTTDYNWTWGTLSSSAETAYSAIAASSDSIYMYAAFTDSKIRVSSDGGNSWSSASDPGQADWTDISCSSSGQYVTAVSSTGDIYSSSDYGATWTSAVVIDQDTYISVAVSGDGSAVFLGGNNGAYLSVDSGSGYVTIPTSDYIASNETYGFNVAASSDGAVLIAVSAFGGVFSSNDTGETWAFFDSNTTFSSVKYANGVAYAASTQDGLYSSTDYGATWTMFDAAPQDEDWKVIAVSPDGTFIAAAASYQRISVSDDGGATWGTIGDGDIWTDLMFVSDGKVLLATSEGKTSINQAIYSDPSSSSKSSSKKSSSKKSSSKKSSSKKSSSKKSSGK